MKVCRETRTPHRMGAPGVDYERFALPGAVKPVAFMVSVPGKGQSFSGLWNHQ